MLGAGMNPSSRRATGLIRSCGIWLLSNAGAAVAVDVAGERIVDAVGHRAEITVPHRHRRDGRAHDVAVVVERALVVAEEEQLALDDRPAQREAAVEETARRRDVREVVAGVGLLVVGENEPPIP